MEININGYTYFYKNSEKLDEMQFIERCWYISKNNPTKIEDYYLLLKYSRIWYNMKYLKCSFEPKLENIVKKYSLTA